MALAKEGGTSNQMARILAIEPDRRQSAKLTMLARNQIHADLVIADSVEQALEALAEAIPDLVLTSAQLPSKESAVLADRLRALGAEGQHVQTFTIPMLGVPGQRARNLQQQKPQPKGARARNLPPAPVSAGCDPVVFGMQVLTLLDRTVGRTPRAAGGESNVVRMTRPVSAPESEPEEISIDIDAEDSDVIELEPIDASELESIEVSQLLDAPALADGDMTAPHREPPPEADWNDVLAAMRQDIERSQHRVSAPPLEANPSLAEVSHAIGDSQVVEPNGTASPSAAVSPETPEVGAASVTGESASPPQKKRRRPKPPRQDEWGFYDPQQCGVSVLISLVNEITGNTGKPPKKPA